MELAMNAVKPISLVLGGMSLLLLAACNEDAKVAQVSTPKARTSHEVCTDQVVTTQKPVKDEKQVLGTIAGAVVGGVVGHEVGGKGTSQDIATGVGAVCAGAGAVSGVAVSARSGAPVASIDNSAPIRKPRREAEGVFFIFMPCRRVHSAQRRRAAARCESRAPML